MTDTKPAFTCEEIKDLIRRLVAWICICSFGAGFGVGVGIGIHSWLMTIVGFLLATLIYPGVAMLRDEILALEIKAGQRGLAPKEDGK
jgi:hypothetical protein